ncbi:uncharacterized mitochondrial protein-like protein [Tanacetum coccineum]
MTITFHTNRGGEFTSHDFNRFCDQEGITRMLTDTYAPQQNGIVERRNRTLLEMTRSLVGVTPYEKFYGEKSNLEDLKVFGCVAYERIVSKHLKKIDDRLKPLIYLGKEPSPRSFRLYNLRENKIIISAYVVFDEKKVHNAIVHAKVNNVHCLITVHETPFHVTSPKGDEDEYENDVTPILVRRSTRNKVLPTRLVDYQLNVHELMLTLDEEPRNYNEAKLNPKWLKAMKTKLESIVKNNTWKLVPLPKADDDKLVDFCKSATKVKCSCKHYEAYDLILKRLTESIKLQASPLLMRVMDVGNFESIVDLCLHKE